MKLKLSGDDVEVIKDARLIMANLRQQKDCVPQMVASAEKDGLCMALVPYLAQANGKSVNTSVVVCCRKTVRGQEWMVARVVDAKAVELSPEHLKEANERIIKAMIETVGDLEGAECMEDLFNMEKNPALKKILKAIVEAAMKFSETGDDEDGKEKEKEKEKEDEGTNLGKDRGDSFSA